MAPQLSADVLVVNPGSASLKIRVLDAHDEVVSSQDLESGADVVEELTRIETVGGVGVRFVHGGSRFTTPTIVDDGVLATLAGLIELAPLHQAASVSAIDAVRIAMPSVPVVAVFDTSFHTQIAPSAATYAVPKAWRNRWDLRRYGFHGLSHAHVARRTAELINRSPDEIRIVSCHLGGGASLAAISDGRSVDTTMGFTPLEGLVMARRSGSVDPGMLLWLQQSKGVSVEELSHALEYESGLMGIAGTPDMREVLARAEGGDDDACLARDVYVHRLRASIASMTAALGGIDALVFTGGVGENAPSIRSMTSEGLSFLGVRLDEVANAAARGDAIVSDPSSSVAVLVVSAREDVEAAHAVRSTLHM